MGLFYQVRLGRANAHADQALKEGFVGVDYGYKEDASKYLKNTWDESRKDLVNTIPKYRPNIEKRSAGLACGAIWSLGRGMQDGATVLAPLGNGSYAYGMVAGDYFYVDGDVLPHRRKITWSPQRLEIKQFSDELRRVLNLPLSIIDLTEYSDEIRNLTSGNLVSRDPEIQNPTAFALESVLEEFLVSNWESTELSKKYKILRDENNELIGQQYPTDTGPIDILAISKDEKEYLVIELKRGRASDKVVGQLLRYMGFVETILEKGQSVKGIIIANEQDKSMEFALRMVPNASFYQYDVSFRLKEL